MARARATPAAQRFSREKKISRQEAECAKVRLRRTVEGIWFDGSRFSGTAAQGLFILGILGVVATVGATAMLWPVAGEDRAARQ